MAKLDDLLNGGEETVVENTSGDTQELSNIDELFQRVNANKVGEIIKETKHKKSRISSGQTPKTNRKSIINESYVREIIREEVADIFEYFLEEISKETTYAVEKAIRLMALSDSDEEKINKSK